MRIDVLSKYQSLKDTKGGKRIFCRIRQKFVPRTPEEMVRQAVLNWLCEEIDIPIEAIEVESRAGEGRADLIVYGEDDFPVLLVECKREEDTLTGDVVNQAADYADSISVDTIAVTNGKDIWAYLYDEKDKQYLPLTRVPAYEELSNSEKLTQYVDKTSVTWTRPRFDQLSDPTVRAELNCIGRDAPEHLHLFILNLCSLLLDDSDRMPRQEKRGWRVDDLGVINSAPSTPVGKWEGDYRVFQVTRAGFERQVRMLVAAQHLLEKEPNRTLPSVLVAAVWDRGKQGRRLQLRLDQDSVHERDNRFTVQHRKRIGEDVLSYLQGIEDAQEILRYDLSGAYIQLGTLDSSHLITWEPETCKFVANVVKYAILRDEAKRDGTW